MRKVMIKGRRAQQTMSLPFGLIFSILLIVVFILIAFIAIRYFLDLGDCTKIGKFYDELQGKVDEAWRSQISSFEVEITLPSGIDQICFANLSAEERGSNEAYAALSRFDVYEANTFIMPPEKGCKMPYKLIKHINISEMTKNKNPYCVDVSKKLKLKKGVYDKLVLIE